MVLPKCALIRAAIVHVNKQHRGASLVQVRKHLEATYEEKLDAKKKKLIHTTFKTLIQEGKLLRKGTVYKSTTNKPRGTIIARADVPQRRYRRRQHRRRRRRSTRRRRHRRRRNTRRRHRHHHHHHHGHHQGPHHHRSKHHRRHHRRRHHKGHHHGHHHGRHHHRGKHHRRHHKMCEYEYKLQHHGENVSVKAPMEKLALSPTTSKLTEQQKKA